MTTTPLTRSTGIQSVERAVQILRAFAEPQQQLTTAHLGELLGVHKSTVSRLTATLVAEGLLENGDDGVRLGSELRRLGRLAAGGADLAEIAQAPMDELARDTGETVTLSVRDGDHALTIAQANGTHRVGAGSWLGGRTPLALTADGKVLLAFGSASTDALARATHAAVTRTRALEWGAAVGDLEEHLHGVAVPVWDEHGTLLAALCVSGPSYRVPESRFERLVEQCRHAAYLIGDRRHGYLKVAR